MDDVGNLTSGPDAALVMLAFLQVDCRNSEYGKELHSLRQEVNLSRDINYNGMIDAPDDGDLETDGHLPIHTISVLGDFQPSVQLQRPGNHAAILEVAEELREIAAQMERSLLVRATQNLSRKISVSPTEQWKDYLTQEVDRVMSQGVGLEHLPQERVVMALTLTLVKGLCERAPLLLRDLFNTALQYFRHGRDR